jgi:glycyl-tRNA synthetase beta chain
VSESKPLLIELGTEELPVKALPELARSFADGIVLGLAKRGVAHGAARCLYSPRRLAVLIDAVGLAQPEQHSEVLGPYLNIALNAEGQPTPALLGFAQKNGVDWSALERTTDAKGARFVHRAVKPGAATAELLPVILAEAVAAMPIPKPMRWGDHAHAFARPLHWLLMLHGEKVVDATLFGAKADLMSRGHRFHHAKPVWISRPQDYIDALRAARVLVDPDERRARIRSEVESAARALGGSARITEDNLEQVNCLVEWPKAVGCAFEESFLRVPQEALIGTMEANQKFFPVLDAEGRLTRHFIGVANIESGDEAEVRKGYERVIRPRFADAQFFFDEDLKQGLAAMSAGLASVTYQQKLGSVADKVARVAALAEAIAPKLGVDAALARRAAELAKADLQSRLVGEFPELQGIAGRYYAAAGGEPAEVAAAIDEAYMPRFAGDAIAPSKLGQVLAVAERVDTLAGGFAVGLKPTGNKDPFALRRNALGLARTLIEGRLELDLSALLLDALDSVRERVPSATGEVHGHHLDGELVDFILDRLRGYYAERGVPTLQFEAVAGALRPVAAEAAATQGNGGVAVGAASAATRASYSLLDFDARLTAIAEFAKLPEAEALAAANKRIRNILRKAEGPIPARIDPSLLVEPAEKELAESVEAAIRETDHALAQRDYGGVLRRLAWLRDPVDLFFDAVMVMAEDAALRRNRLALLKRLSDRFLAVADVSVLAAG